MPTMPQDGRPALLGVVVYQVQQLLQNFAVCHSRTIKATPHNRTMAAT